MQSLLFESRDRLYYAYHFPCWPFAQHAVHVASVWKMKRHHFASREHGEEDFLLCDIFLNMDPSVQAFLCSAWTDAWKRTLICCRMLANFRRIFFRHLQWPIISTWHVHSCAVKGQFKVLTDLDIMQFAQMAMIDIDGKWICELTDGFQVYSRVLGQPRDWELLYQLAVMDQLWGSGSLMVRIKIDDFGRFKSLANMDDF